MVSHGIKINHTLQPDGWEVAKSLGIDKKSKNFLCIYGIQMSAQNKKKTSNFNHGLFFTFLFNKSYLWQ